MTEKLAINGGTPVRDEKNSLPSLFPRKIIPIESSLKLMREVLEPGFGANMVGSFEDAFAKAVGAKYAIALHNCTAGLHACEAALDCEAGDEIIVSAISDFGSAEGILSERLVPVFADVDERTGLVTAEEIEKVITDRTKAMIVVHFYGQMCDMDSIMELANRHNIPVFEDCAQSCLVKYKGKFNGTIGLAGAWSLAPEKTLSVDGLGVVVTDDKEFSHLVRLYSQLRGVEGSKEGFGRLHSRLGINFRADELRSALGIAQLEVILQELQRKIKLAEELTERLLDIDGILPPKLYEGAEHGYWLYSFQVESDNFNCTIDDFAKAQNAEGLEGGTGRYYLLPECMTMLHKGTKEYNRLIKTIPRLEEREYNADMTPKAKRHLERMIRWPWTDKYTDKDIKDIAKIIRKVAEYYHK